MDYMNIRTIDGEYNGEKWKLLTCGEWIENIGGGLWVDEKGNVYELRNVECSDNFCEVAYLLPMDIVQFRKTAAAMYESKLINLTIYLDTITSAHWLSPAELMEKILRARKLRF